MYVDGILDLNMRKPRSLSEIVELDSAEPVEFDHIYADELLILYHSEDFLILEDIQVEVIYSGTVDEEYYLLNGPSDVTPYLRYMLEKGGWKLISKKSQWKHTYIRGSDRLAEELVRKTLS